MRAVAEQASCLTSSSASGASNVGVTGIGLVVEDASINGRPGGRRSSSAVGMLSYSCTCSYSIAVLGLVEGHVAGSGPRGSQNGCVSVMAVDGRSLSCCYGVVP